MRACLVVISCALVAGACSSSHVAPTSTVMTLSIDGNVSFTLKGETSQLAARATLSDGRIEDDTVTAEWSSSDSTIATVSRTGLLTAVGDGRTIVTAKLAAITATRSVMVDLPQAR